MARTRAYRRHQTHRHMMRRLKEDWNQHYDRPNYIDPAHVVIEKWRRALDGRWFLSRTYVCCSCFYDPAIQAQFKEQPQKRSDPWKRYRRGMSRQELRHTRHPRNGRWFRPIDQWEDL
jgi:hypothetical protein